MFSVAATTIGAIALGNSSRAMMCRFVAPMARAARVNSRSRSDRTWLRTMRATSIQAVTSMIKVMVSRFGLTKAARPSSTTIVGKLSTASANRMITLSTTPPW